MQLGKDESKNLTIFSYDGTACQEEIVDYIIRAEQHFNMMETHDFSRAIQRVINPQFRSWSGNTMKRDIMKKFHTQKENFKNYFANFERKFCLIYDIWTSLTYVGFLYITAHYIDNE